MIESWIVSTSESMKGYIEYVKKMLDGIKKKLDDIFEIVNELLDLLRVITSATVYASIFTIEAGGNETLKEAYRKMLVNDVSPGLKSVLSKYRDNGLIMALGVVKPGPILPSAWSALFNATQKESEANITYILSEIEDRVRRFKEAQQLTQV
jgi:signal transduction histidine kinase